MNGANQPVAAPSRLLSEQGRLGELLRSATGHADAPDQREAFDRLLARVRAHRTSRSRAMRLTLPAVAAVLVAVVIGVFGIGRGSDSPEASNGPSAPREARVSTLEFALPVGQTELEDGSRVRVADRGSARARTGAFGSRIELESGTVTLEVEKQSKGRTLEVRAKSYRFVALGTVFNVSASAERVVLEVLEGRVGVIGEGTTMAEVGAGETWSREMVAQEVEPLVPASPQAPASAPPSGARAAPGSAGEAVERAEARTSATAPSAVEQNCLALVRERRARDAEHCFEARASGSGLSAEMALFELSRLRSDVLNDPPGALAALKEYRSRFPGGSLRAEANLSYVHLLSRLGRHGEVVTEIGKLLQTATGRERSHELRMLRANTLRTQLRDFASAEREYAALETSGGKLSLEATYYRGVCLQAMGSLGPAAAAYQRYLDVPGRPREAEARRRLGEIRQ